MMEASLYNPRQISHGIMDEEEELGTSSSSSSGNSAGWNDSSSSELTDDATSANMNRQHSQGSPYEMSSLMAQLPLPFKSGLSRHFQGKSQSFTSLANARSLEDLAKPESPYYRKRLKPCRSYGAGLDSQRPHFPVNGCSKAITKRPTSRGAQLPSLLVKRPGFLSGKGRPPVPPHRSGSFSSQTLLFA